MLRSAAMLGPGMTTPAQEHCQARHLTVLVRVLLLPLLVAPLLLLLVVMMVLLHQQHQPPKRPAERRRCCGQGPPGCCQHRLWSQCEHTPCLLSQLQGQPDHKVGYRQHHQPCCMPAVHAVSALGCCCSRCSHFAVCLPPVLLLLRLLPAAGVGAAEAAWGQSLPVLNAGSTAQP
jgi:hypothetical protein